MTTTDFSERYIAAFYEDTDALNVKRASQNPKATEFIEAMIEFIQELVDKEFAYVSQGDVYFRVSKSKDYAKLANKNLADLLAGASGRTMKKQNLKNHQPILLFGNPQKLMKFLGKLLGELAVQAGILNVQSCQLHY